MSQEEYEHHVALLRSFVKKHATEWPAMTEDAVVGHFVRLHASVYGPWAEE